VELTVTGSPRPLSPGTELSGYRIVSEALANVARHAPGAATGVTLRYGAAALEIEVRNAAPPHPHRLPAGPASGRGLGIRGMRERAELYGGVLAAGPGPGGGFTVTAAIPVAEAGAGVTAPNAMTRGERAPGGTGAGANVLPRNPR
jgi:signal transduction histidine kinase